MMMKKIVPRIAVIVLAGILLFSAQSCQLLYPSNMLRTPRHYAYDTLHLDSATFSKDYLISPNDVIEFKLYANDGFRLIDLIASQGTNGNLSATALRGIEFQLDGYGRVKLPMLGVEDIHGMTVRQAETYLEKRYTDFYVKPFVIIKVINRRVIVYPGSPGLARVVSLDNTNTTVLEALAMVGGITDNGKANNVKLIRQTGDPNHPKIYKLDLSRVQNIAQGNVVVESNDIIYVQPRQRIASRALQDITPVLTLFTTVLTFYLLLKKKI